MTHHCTALVFLHLLLCGTEEKKGTLVGFGLGRVLDSFQMGWIVLPASNIRNVLLALCAQLLCDVIMRHRRGKIKLL